MPLDPNRFTHKTSEALSAASQDAVTAAAASVSAARLFPSESNDPDRISASMTFRLFNRTLTRQQKSVSETKRPSAARASAAEFSGVSLLQSP